MQDSRLEVYNILVYNTIALKFDPLQWEQHSKSGKLQLFWRFCFCSLEGFFFCLGFLKGDEFIRLWCTWIVFYGTAALTFSKNAAEICKQVNWSCPNTATPLQYLHWRQRKRAKQNSARWSRRPFAYRWRYTSFKPSANAQAWNSPSGGPREAEGNKKLKERTKNFFPSCPH